MKLHRRGFLEGVSASIGLMAMGAALLREVAAAQAGGPLQNTLVMRKEELKRRVEGLPEELDRWQVRVQQDLDKNAHFSQVRAIRILMDVFIKRQRILLEKMDPAGSRDDFLALASDVVDNIINAQFVWQFFGSKLNLRYVPGLKDSLWVADTVAHDCYRPTLEYAANQHKILSKDELREPPLCYYVPKFSAATWARYTQPEDLRDRERGKYRTPIPVIELPADHAVNSWEFVTLAHEVGHDLEADLQLHDSLVTSLRDALTNADTPPERHEVWMKWRAEAFADLVGLQLVGTAFAETLMHLLLLPAAEVTGLDAKDPHPNHHVRIMMCTAYLRTLIPPDSEETDAAAPAAELEEDAKRIEGIWTGLYGDPPDLRPYRKDFPAVFRGLMDTKLALLQNKTMRDVVVYNAAIDGMIRQAIPFMLTGENPPAKTAPRLCAAAARLAASQAARELPAGGSLTATFAKINANMAALVHINQPPGLRAANTSGGHTKFIEGFADLILPEGRRPPDPAAPPDGNPGDMP